MLKKYVKTIWERLKHAYTQIKLYHAVKDGLNSQEFQVYYQPKYHLTTGETTGAEALIRWVRSDGRMVMPGVFIPYLEKSGRITDLDVYVIRQVCSFLGRLRKKGVALPRISINLSRFHLKTPEIIRIIQEAVAQNGLDPSCLSFEITESLFYNHIPHLQYIVESLHQIGCTVEIDDYGTGISNLYTLSQVEFDTLKIDRKYIQQIGNSRAEWIIQSIIELADRLQIAVIAEGIETAEQEAFLLAHNCPTGQGYYYSQPVSEAAFQAKLMQQTHEKARSENAYEKSI